VDEADLEILAELAEDGEGVRGALSEPDLRQLDFLLGLFAGGTGEQHAEGVGRAVAEHLRRALPEEAGPQIAGRRLHGGGRSTAQALRTLADSYAEGVPLTLGPPAAPGPGAPDDVASLFRAITDRLLGAPSLTPAELRDEFQQDPDHPHLIRLARPGEPPRLPAFQFDEEGRPLPVVLAVNALLGSAVDPWGVADWWLGPNLWLGRPPARLLGSCPDSHLLDAARAVGEVV
jgi:hypothetical protein